MSNPSWESSTLINSGHLHPFVVVSDNDPMCLASVLPAFHTTTPLTLSRHRPNLVTRLQKLPQHARTPVHRPLQHNIKMVASLPSPTTHPQSVAGKNPVFAQCMLRINNPTASKDFYNKLGMKFFTRFDFPDFKFSLFFYAYSNASVPPLADPQSDRAKWLWARPEPTVELTWNWPGDTYEESLKLAEAGNKTEDYVNGNTEPLGFCCLQIAVNDLSAAVAALKADGMQFIEERLNDDRPSATVADPDGYHVSIAGPSGHDTAKPMAELDPVFDAVELRVKDPRSAIPFFEHLGFRYLTRVDNEADKCTKYFLAYTNKTSLDAAGVQKMRECKLKLVHVWGTEEEGDQTYANGNVKPYRGFGHVGVIVDDIHKTMDALTKEGYNSVRKPGPFADVGDIAFIAEPSTSYWIEIITRAGQTADVPYEQPVLG